MLCSLRRHGRLRARGRLRRWVGPRCRRGVTIGWVGRCGRAGGRGGSLHPSQWVSVVRHESWMGGLGKGTVGGGAGGAEWVGLCLKAVCVMGSWVPVGVC